MILRAQYGSPSVETLEPTLLGSIFGPIVVLDHPGLTFRLPYCPWP